MPVSGMSMFVFTMAMGLQHLSSFCIFNSFILFYRLQNIRDLILKQFEGLTITIKRGPIDCACVRETIATHAAIRDFCSRGHPDKYPAPNSINSANQGNKRSRGGYFKKRAITNSSPSQSQGRTRGQSHERPQDRPRNVDRT